VIFNRKPRTAIFISGRGSNMRALIEAAQDENYPATVALVVSNRPDAIGLDFAQSAGVATKIVDHKLYRTRVDFEAALQNVVQEARIDLIALAGFMRILSPWFVSLWNGKMLNIHPSLLPNFKGLLTHERALAAGVRAHGCSVHWVTPLLDSGAVIAQTRVPVMDEDTPETLGARVLAIEHGTYVEALRRVALCL
jgi:phosphoribosylglycinamide formyltransferase 1